MADRCFSDGGYFGICAPLNPGSCPRSWYCLPAARPPALRLHMAGRRGGRPPEIMAPVRVRRKPVPRTNFCTSALPSSCFRQSPAQDRPRQVRDHGQHRKLHQVMGYDPMPRLAAGRIRQGKRRRTHTARSARHHMKYCKSLSRTGFNRVASVTAASGTVSRLTTTPLDTVAIIPPVA